MRNDNEVNHSNGGNGNCQGRDHRADQYAARSLGLRGWLLLLLLWPGPARIGRRVLLPALSRRAATLPGPVAWRVLLLVLRVLTVSALRTLLAAGRPAAQLRMLLRRCLPELALALRTLALRTLALALRT